MTEPVQPAGIRRRIRIPLRLADDYSTTATVVSFTGLTDTSAAQMLHALGANPIRLLSNNPDKAAQLARLGLTIAKRVPTALHVTGTNAAYLATKARRGGHDLLSQGLERAAEPFRCAGPGHLGIAD